MSDEPAQLVANMDNEANMDSDDDASSSHRKRMRPNDTPPDPRILQESKKVNVCGHCNKKCTLRSEAIQCDLCQSWVHASCEGISKENYKLLTRAGLRDCGALGKVNLVGP